MMQGPDIELWALDEVIFQLHGTRCRMWIAPEENQPIIFHNPVNKNVGYYGAVRLHDGKFVYQREQEKFNGDTCQTFLKFLRRITAHSSKRITIMADNARYHHARVHKDWRNACSDHFSLDFLPPYSPELNPIERVWKLTRRACTHNRYFLSIDHIINAVEPRFDRWRQGSDILSKLCAIN